MANIRKALVTGGCGFIGSHVVEGLVARGAQVVVYDNLKTGFERHLDSARRGGAVTLVSGDVLDLDTLRRAMAGVDSVFHFAANADVRGGPTDTAADLEQNVIGTQRVLDCCRLEKVSTFVLASSATVYGEPAVFPTPEDAPRTQTSLYGASKLAAEAFAEAYAEYFGIRTIAFRFVSWIGERYSHGVVFDFVNKLRASPGSLEILGDGRQQKSYLYVGDGVDAILTALDAPPQLKAVYNLGHDYTVDVTQVARIVIRELGLTNVALRYGGGQRGWLGDSPVVHLDTARIRSLGWRPRVAIEEGLARTVRYLVRNPWHFEKR